MQPYFSTKTLYVGIDIGKNVHCYGGFSGEKLDPVDAIVEVRSDREGYEQFQKWLWGQVKSQRYDKVVVGIEATGVYHQSWQYAIEEEFERWVEVRVMNPYQTQQKRQQLQNGRKRKSDSTDVEAIAFCLRDGGGQAGRRWDEVEGECWAAEYRQMMQELRRAGQNLLTQWDRLWPGAVVDVKAFQRAHPEMTPPRPLVLSKPLERQLVRAILGEEPNPYFWREKSEEEIRSWLKARGVRCGKVTARLVQTVARQAMLLPEAVAALLSERIKRDFQQYRSVEERVKALEAQAVAFVPSSPAGVLLTVPGINASLAARYLAYVGDVNRFDHADQIWSLAGFDVEQDDSGDRRRFGKITRRGEPDLRLTLYTLGVTTSRNCPAIQSARLRALQRGKSPTEATLHAAHKANRLCFHLMRHQEVYDEQIT